jgi:hypothetical protein
MILNFITLHHTGAKIRNDHFSFTLQFCKIWGCAGKFPDFYSCNGLSERRWEGRLRSHFHKPIASVCYVTLHCEHTLFLQECFFDSFCLQRMAKSSNTSVSSFAWSSVNLLPNPLNASWGFWRTFFQPDSGFWMTFMFQGQSSVRWRWWMFRASKHQQNDKMFKTRPQKLSPNNR